MCAFPDQLAGMPATLTATTVFAALGNETRLEIVLMLLDGRRLCVADIAAALDRPADGVGLHLKKLHQAGVLQAHFGEDRRQSVYSIPLHYCANPDVLDFGVCTVALAPLRRIRGR